MVSEIKIRKASKKDLKEIAGILRIELSNNPTMKNGMKIVL